MTVAPTPTPAPLSIVVIGVGGIGSTFALYLARAGHAVTVVARPGSKRLAQLRRDGGLATTAGERVPVTVADGLDAEVAHDLVIVTVLDHQVDALLPTLAASRARAIQFMFNTFDPQRLGAAVGAARCGFGMPFIMATLDADGRLASTVPSSRKTLHGDRRWAALFNQAGLPSAFEPDMQLWLRCHVPLCMAMESISAAAVRRGGGASWTEARTVARGLRAGFRIVEGQGLPLYPAGKARLARAPIAVTAALLWGVSRIASFRDLLATGAAECRALADKVAAAAAQATPPLLEAAEGVRAMKPPA